MSRRGRRSDVAVVSVPWGAIDEAWAEIGADVVIVETTNPSAASPLCCSDDECAPTSSESPIHLGSGYTVTALC